MKPKLLLYAMAGVLAAIAAPSAAMAAPTAPSWWEQVQHENDQAIGDMRASNDQLLGMAASGQSSPESSHPLLALVTPATAVASARPIVLAAGQGSQPNAYQIPIGTCSDYADTTSGAFGSIESRPVTHTGYFALHVGQ